MTGCLCYRAYLVNKALTSSDQMIDITYSDISRCMVAVGCDSPPTRAASDISHCPHTETLSTGFITVQMPVIAGL